jgi:hypothetical protein
MRWWVIGLSDFVATEIEPSGGRGACQTVRGPPGCPQSALSFKTLRYLKTLPQHWPLIVCQTPLPPEDSISASSFVWG